MGLDHWHFRVRLLGNPAGAQESAGLPGLPETLNGNPQPRRSAQLTSCVRSRGGVLRRVNRISTRFLSSRDLANVFILQRATLRAYSWMSHEILRAAAVVQHFDLIEHASQWRFEAVRHVGCRQSCHWGKMQTPASCASRSLLADRDVRGLRPAREFACPAGPVGSEPPRLQVGIASTSTITASSMSMS